MVVTRIRGVDRIALGRSEEPVCRDGPETVSQLLQRFAAMNDQAAGPLVAERLRQRPEPRAVPGADPGAVLGLDADRFPPAVVISMSTSRPERVR